MGEIGFCCGEIGAGAAEIERYIRGVETGEDLPRFDGNVGFIKESPA